MFKQIAVFFAFFFIVFCVAKSNYSFDGSGNNQKNPNWGKSGENLARKVPLAYADGISMPVGGNPSTLPSTRMISNLIFGRDPAGSRKENPRLVTDVLTFWGQFIDHDIDLSPDSNCDPFFIPVPRGDPFYDNEGTGTKTMKFCRTIPTPGTGNSTTNPRQFPNVVTAWIDASTVYGNNEKEAKALRTGSGGLLKTSQGPDGELPPLNNDGTGKGLVPTANPAGRVNVTQLYACGDRRCNENPILLALHALFVREHNRRARALPANMNDEQKYQEARRWVIGHIQAITFNEYLPTLINAPVPKYTGYKDTVDPTVNAFFSTVAFRYGHDEVNSVITRLKNDGQVITEGNILLRDAYFWPKAMSSVGIGPYLRGASVNPQQAVDGLMEEDMRTFLFGQAPNIATDLAARNLQRGRDHGLARYNDCRKAYGLSTCNTFSCITKESAVAALLDQAYGKDNVRDLDPYVGGLVEPKVKSSNLGEMFTVSILDQLTRLRDGDRFWYQKDGIFSSSERKELDETTLSDIIKRNTDTKTLPKHVFTRKNEAGALALGAGRTSNTRWIIGIIIPTVVAAILIAVVISMCAKKNSRSNSVNDDKSYNLLENQDN